jgi:hypothetical protein
MTSAMSADMTAAKSAVVLIPRCAIGPLLGVRFLIPEDEARPTEVVPDFSVRCRAIASSFFWLLADVPRVQIAGSAIG